MIGPYDMLVNRRRRAGASGVPVSAATWHLDAHGRRLRDELQRGKLVADAIAAGLTRDEDVVAKTRRP